MYERPHPTPTIVGNAALSVKLPRGGRRDVPRRGQNEGLCGSEGPLPPERRWGVAQELGMADAASTLLGVSVLGYEGRLVEIEAIAVLD